jgi:hypothetical protein
MRASGTKECKSTVASEGKAARGLNCFVGMTGGVKKARSTVKAQISARSFAFDRNAYPDLSKLALDALRGFHDVLSNGLYERSDKPGLKVELQGFNALTVQMGLGGLSAPDQTAVLRTLLEEPIRWEPVLFALARKPTGPRLELEDFRRPLHQDKPASVGAFVAAAVYPWLDDKAKDEAMAFLRSIGKSGAVETEPLGSSFPARSGSLAELPPFSSNDYSTSDYRKGPDRATVDSAWATHRKHGKR